MRVCQNGTPSFFLFPPASFCFLQYSSPYSPYAAIAVLVGIIILFRTRDRLYMA